MSGHTQVWRVRGVFLALLVGGLVSGPVAADQGGNAERGAELYPRRCGACHSVDRDRVGPKHRGIVGRTAGTVPDYRYSRSLRQSEIVWNVETLDRWLSNPEAFIPGQKMGFRLSNAGERRDIIAYLRTLREP